MRKDFRVAQIVPVPYLELTKDNQYHMCLAHLVLQSPEYQAFYARMVKEGKYVLMDNGAAEGEQPSCEEIMQAYEMVHPTELILSDSLCDAAETFTKTIESYLYYQERELSCKFMAVPQGKTVEEWIESAQQLCENLPGISSLGVSKFLNSVTEDDKARVKAVQALNALFTARPDLEKEIHLLGSHVGPEEAKLAADISPYVRGNDTALAYVFAMNNQIMTEDSARPSGEVDFIHHVAADKLVRENLLAHERLLGIKNNSYDPGNLAWQN